MTNAEAGGKFFSRQMWIWLALYALFALTFVHFQVYGDALVYFNLLRRFAGEHPDFAFAYQFGSDVWNAPFFAVGRVLSAIFSPEPKIFHVSIEEISITVACQVAFLVTLYLGWKLLRGLRLPASASVLFVTVLGSQLFYYVMFEPAMKHAVDTLYITAAVVLLLRIQTRSFSDRHVVALGALAGVSVNTRYVNAAFFFAIAVAFALTNKRALILAGSVAVLVGGLLFALPALRGISYFEPSYFPRSAIAHLASGGSTGPVASTTNPFNGFDPLIPLKMLFTDHRGMFVWTPLTAFGAVGYALALRREHEAGRRRFLWTLLGASVALLVGHTFWAEWDGAYSYSSRFLTAEFPLVLIGIAELRRRFGRSLYVPLAACIGWSFILMFVHVVGYDGITAGDSATDEIHHFVATPSQFVVKVRKLGTKRWVYIGGLMHGTDPDHVHGP
ncbi:MAG TPA: glycosyltransferase family 39 protein [Gemmatimonadaceae bacterium]|nr:glycosyltransferase family 39 protein [Gemmatimonadaceae bacterium]